MLLFSQSNPKKQNYVKKGMQKRPPAKVDKTKQMTGKVKRQAEDIA